MRRISESESGVHIVLEVWSDVEPHGLLQTNRDSGQAFLEAFAASMDITHPGIDKILMGPDRVPDAEIPQDRPGGRNWSETPELAYGKG